MRRLIWLLLMIAIPVVGQVNNPTIIPVPNAPSGPCTSPLPDQQTNPGGVIYTCQNGQWGVASGSGTILANNSIQVSGSPFVVPATSGFYWNNTASTYSFAIPAPVVGLQLCFGDYQARTGAVSVIPSTGVTIYFKGAAGTVSSATGLVSGGAAGDFICLVATDSTTYMAIGGGYGTWTNH